MDDPIAPEAALVAALKLTAPPPEAWVEAATLLPSTLGELDRIQDVTSSPAFRERFATDPATALAEAGLPTSPALMAAMRFRLADT